MRILYLAQRVPYPPDRGDKIITFHHVRHLARSHEVTVVCLAQGDADLDNAAALRSIVSQVHAVRLSPYRARLRACQALLQGQPFTLGYFNEEALRRRVDELVRRNAIDLAMVFCSGMAQFVESAGHLPRILHFADLDSQKWKEYSRQAHFPQRWVYAAESRRLLRYERQLANSFDHCFVCTRSELNDFRRLAGEANVTYLANGVDLAYFQPVASSPPPASLVFTGVMDYPPNVDGVTWFCQEIFPRIRQHVPEATFTICGARPTRAVRDLANLPGVAVTGRVPDVRPYLSAASVAVVPLRICRGIQNKVLEAMAMGLPVVTTPAAYEGIEAEPGTDLLVAQDADAFAMRVCELIGDVGARKRLGRAARTCVQLNYRWDVPLERLDAVLDSVACHKQESPQLVERPSMALS